MGLGRGEVLKGVAVTVVAYFLVKKLARDIGREADRIGQEIHSEDATSAAVAVFRQEADRILDNTSARLQNMATNCRLNCKLQGASLLCEIEPKDPLPAKFSGSANSASKSSAPADHAAEEQSQYVFQLNPGISSFFPRR